jgi:hypothetical protein
MKKPSLVILLASVCLTGVASAAWHRLPSADSEPVNLANPIVLGTEVHSSTGITNLSALIADSSAEAANLVAGKSEAVLSVGDQQLIEAVAFLNDSATGKLVVSGSTDLKEWLPLAQASYSATERQVIVKFAGAQVKYVRLAFENEKASTIRSIKLSGPATTKDYQAVPVKESKAVDVNLASSSLGARPIYMFPTPSNAGEGGQSFKFPKTNERFRTVVYDLGAVRTIKKFNAAYSRVPTRLQVFAFETLPEKKDWRGKMTLEPTIFDEQKPVATGEDARGEGSIQLVPERPVQAQYVALRFEPNYNKQRSVTGLNADFEAVAIAAVAPLSGIARELGLFETGEFVQASAAGGGDEGEDFVVYDAAAGGSVPLVLISRSAIAMSLSKLPPGTSEASAINAILTAAGFTPLAGGAGGSGPGGGGNKPQSQVADTAPGGGYSTAGLNALGLSAYRGSGGGTGGSPFQPNNNNNNNNGNNNPGNNNPGNNNPGNNNPGPPPVIINPTSP